MAFPITGVAIANGLGANADEVAARLRDGHVSRERDRAPIESAASTRAHALLEHAYAELDVDLGRARNRWGARRLAVLVGCAFEPDPLLALAVRLCASRGPAYAVTSGRFASAHAVVSAQHLLAAGIADAVAVGTVSHEPAAEGAAWLLLERQADADVELVRAVDRIDDADVDWIVTDGDVPARSRSTIPRIALADASGDLGAANGLSAAVTAVLALQHGFVPDPRSPAALEQECDRVACTTAHGSLAVTLTIGARAS